MTEMKYGLAKEKYLVCSYDEPDDETPPDVKYLEKEAFQSFADAVAQYLFRCATRDNVILANLENETIIRQYAHAGTTDEDYGASDALYIS